MKKCNRHAGTQMYMYVNRTGEINLQFHMSNFKNINFFFQLNKNIIVQNGEIIYLFALFLLALTINFTALYSRRKQIRLFAKKFYVSSNNE